jgi:hypothetical protein
VSDGRWEEIEISYRDNEGSYCACCGKHVARRLYVVNIAGAARRFCSTDCADLYEWYWLPRYGADRADPRTAQP